MKKVTIAWFLDYNSDKSQFQDINDSDSANIRFFHTTDRYINYITQDENHDETFILVICEYSESKALVKGLHDLDHVISIYLGWTPQEEEEEENKKDKWMEECVKIRAICHTVEELFNKIGEELNGRKRRLFDSLSINIYNSHDTDATKILTIFNRTEQSSTSDLRTENGNFLWFQLYIAILLRMNYHREQAKANLIQYCKRLYKDDKNELRKLEDFEKTYSPDDAIKWYTKETPIYHLLNKALRLKNVDLITAFSWFIADIYKQLLKENISQKFERLQNSTNEFLSTNSFLSTSVDRKVALGFAGISSDDLIATLFEVTVDKNAKNLKPYADISKFSVFKDENETLFMLGSVFRIIKVEFNVTEKIWIISLNTCTENDQDYRQLYEHEEKEIVGENPTYYNLAELFYRLGDYDRSERYFKLHLKYRRRPEDIVLCHAGLSKVFNRKKNSELQQKHQVEAMQGLQNQTKGITDPKLIQELETARKQLFDENENCEIHILRAHANMQNKRDDLALVDYTKALTIQKRQLPSDHPDIGRTLFQMGHCYVALKMFDKGLEFMQQALEILQKSLPENHQDLALTYSSLGSVYTILMKNDVALEHFIKAREIHHASGRPDQLDLWIVETSIKRIENSGSSSTSTS
ncbi:unnamed protein product [Rotaria sp. Silwood2]|nr:unnamed protein product [Rotaria sp. Silwood2]